MLYMVVGNSNMRLLLRFNQIVFFYSIDTNIIELYRYDRAFSEK